jgi:hypothetical protein
MWLWVINTLLPSHDTAETIATRLIDVLFMRNPAASLKIRPVQSVRNRSAWEVFCAVASENSACYVLKEGLFLVPHF